MCYLANILTKEPYEDDMFYNIVDTSEKIVEGIPTLIIGWEEAKELYPEANILDWEINENTYWTFKKRVRRERYEEDSKKFKELVLDRTLSHVKYRFFNVLTATQPQKERLNNFLKDNRPKNAVISGDMLYLYNPETATTSGVSLSDISYIGGDKKKVLRLLYSNEATHLAKEKDYISYQSRDLIKNKKYIIPFLDYLANSKEV